MYVWNGLLTHLESHTKEEMKSVFAKDVNNCSCGIIGFPFLLDCVPDCSVRGRALENGISEGLLRIK